MAKWPLNRTGSAREEQNWNQHSQKFSASVLRGGNVGCCLCSCRFFNTDPTEKHCETGSVPWLGSSVLPLPWAFLTLVWVWANKDPPCGTIPSVMCVSSVSKQPCGYEAGPSNGRRAAGWVLGDVCYGFPFVFVFVFFQISFWINVLKQNFYFWSL